MPRDTGLDTLLDLDGTIIDQGGGYWVKIEARLLDRVLQAHRDKQ
jgi:hypothetical protein